MFLAFRASCSLAVRAMRSCAQGWSGGLAFMAGGLGGPSRSQGSREVCEPQPPSSIPRQKQNQKLAKVNFVAGCSTTRKIGVKVHVVKKIALCSSFLIDLLFVLNGTG